MLISRTRRLPVIVALLAFVGLGLASRASAQDTTVWPFLQTPKAVAVDSSGDVFIADAGSGLVQEVPKSGSGYGTQKTIASGLQSPGGIALDSAGNLFVSNTGANTLLEIPLTSGHYGAPQTILSTGLSAPEGLAIDAFRNVFIADSGHNRVLELSRNDAGSYTVQKVVDASGLSGPQAVAVPSTASSDNVFIADTGNNRIVEVQPSGSNWGTPAAIATGASAPSGIALGADGYVFFSNANDLALDELVPQVAGGYGAPTGVTNFDSAQGLASDAAGDIFVTDAGARTVTKLLAKSGGGVSGGVAVLSGIAPAAVAVDSGGDLFTGGQGTVVEIPALTGGGYTAPKTVSSVCASPFGITLDGGGDLFVACSTQNEVIEFKPNGSGGFGNPIVIDSALSHPDGIAFDAHGNLFIADTFNQRIVELAPNGSGGFAAPAVIASGLNSPAGVAVDPDGNLFYTETGAKDVVELPSDGHGGYLPHVVIDSSGLTFPFGLAFDAVGNLYVGDETGEQVVEIPTDGHGGFGTPFVFDTAQAGGPLGLAFDHAGDLFIAADHIGQILEHAATPPASVKVAVSHQADGRYTVTATAQTGTGTTLSSYQDASPAWSDADGALGSQTPSPFINGVSVTSGVSLPTASNSDTLTVTTGGVSGTSASFSVFGPLAQFAVSHSVSTVTTGVEFAMAVRAEDSFGHVITNYAGSPSWSDASGQISGRPVAFVNGVSTQHLTLDTPFHADTVTVTGGGVSTTSPSFTVLGPLAQFVVSHSVSTVATGVQFTMAVRAEDSAGNVITKYTGTPTWSDASGQISGHPAAFVSGVSTQHLTLNAPYHADTVTVTGSGISTTSPSFTVLGPLTKFVVSRSVTTVTAGVQFAIAVRAEDSAGNVITKYTGTPTWSDASGQISGHPVAFVSGVSTQHITLNTPYHADTVTVTGSGVSTTSGAFNVVAAGG